MIKRKLQAEFKNQREYEQFATVVLNFNRVGNDIKFLFIDEEFMEEEFDLEGAGVRGAEAGKNLREQLKDIIQTKKTCQTCIYKDQIFYVSSEFLHACAHSKQAISVSPLNFQSTTTNNEDKFQYNECCHMHKSEEELGKQDPPQDPIRQILFEFKDFLEDRSRWAYSSLLNEFIDNKKELISFYLSKFNNITPYQAIIGFISWLTTRTEKIILSSTNDVVPIMELFKLFCEVNKLNESGESWDYESPLEELTDIKINGIPVEEIKGSGVEVGLSNWKCFEENAAKAEFVGEKYKSPVTKIYKITHPENLGPEWLCKDNLEYLMKSIACIGESIQSSIKVEDITKQLLPSEALYSFFGWLTSLDDKKGYAETYGKYNVEELILQFINANSLQHPRSTWPSNTIWPDLKDVKENIEISKKVCKAAEAIGADINELLKLVEKYNGNKNLQSQM